MHRAARVRTCLHPSGAQPRRVPCKGLSRLLKGGSVARAVELLGQHEQPQVATTPFYPLIPQVFLITQPQICVLVGDGKQSLCRGQQPLLDRLGLVVKHQAATKRGHRPTARARPTLTLLACAAIRIYGHRHIGNKWSSAE